METLTKAKIAEIINREIGLSREDAITIVNDIMIEMVNIITEEGLLKISSFGTFKVIKKKDRIGRNLKTLQKTLIKEHKALVFHPSILLKQSINNDQSS